MKKKTKDNYNDARGDISLEMGSSEYKEYLMDKQGISEKDQERIDKGLSKIDDAIVKEEEKEVDYREKLFNARKEKEKLAKERDETTKKATYDLNKERLAKRVMLSELEKEALDKAHLTPELDDDKKALDIEEKSLDMVYDDSVSDEEFIPLAFKKYM